jgi:hypothetical protein
MLFNEFCKDFTSMALFAMGFVMILLQWCQEEEKEEEEEGRLLQLKRDYALEII